MWSILATQILICILAVVVIGFDVWLGNNGIPHDTISEVIHQWAIFIPFVPYFWGVLIGHWFWTLPAPVFGQPWSGIALGMMTILMILLSIIFRHFSITVQ